LQTMTTPTSSNSHLAALVNAVLAAAATVLLQLQLLTAPGVQSGHVVPLFALGTFENDRFTHDASQGPGVRGQGPTAPTPLPNLSNCPQLPFCSQTSIVAGASQFWPLTPDPNQFTYLMIFVTTPEPTVRPPSRMAKRRLSTMATG